MASAALWRTRAARSAGTLLRGIILGGVAFLVFAVVLVAAGKDPLRAYADILSGTVFDRYGLSEVLVKMTPLMLTALAVAIPSRIWLINIGGEGQLYVGALLATWAATHWMALPASALLPLVGALGFLGGGVWASIPGVLRAKGWVSETISTLLLNYVAILLVNFFVFGPWKDPQSANYPQTAELVPAARLPSFFGTRVHLGLVVALVALLVYALVLAKTRWGLEIRAIGANREAAARSGLAISRYILVLMFLGGGMAGLAGMGEVSAIQGRLRPSLSPGYGYTGFLIGWIAGGNPYGIAAAALLMAVITAGGDILQMAYRLPGSVVNILMALMLFVVLARRGTT